MTDITMLEGIAGGLDHPEGVAYGPDGNLYAGGEGGQVYRVNLQGKSLEQLASTGGFCLGMALDADSNVYMCDMGVKGVVKITPGGQTSLYSQGPGERPMTVPNYPVFDAAGNLYVSNSSGWGKNNGYIYRILPDGSSEVWSERASNYTNGMALSPDDRYLYVVESALPGVSRIAIEEDGRAGEYDVVVELPQTVPDGIAFDAEGSLYIGCYAPDRIYRYTATGKLEVLFDDWTRLVLNAPTNIAFAGAKRERLAVASLGGYSLVWADVGVKGHPLHYPKLNRGIP